jgi:hypothetical protein
VPLRDAEGAALPVTADRHGLSVAAARAAGRRPDAPRETVARLQDAARRQRVMALRGLSDLVAVVRGLEASGVPAVALKGPALSAWLYGDPGFRRFADLDLVVRPADRMRALAALEALGFRLPSGMTRRTAEGVYGPLGAWPLSRAGAHPVDLHWKTSHVRFRPPVSPDALVRRAAVMAFGGTAVRIPSSTDAALLTLLHAAKHLWCSLEMVAAIGRLAARPDVDWNEVRRLAREAGAWRGCAAGLALAAKILHAEMPDAVRADTADAESLPLQNDALAALRSPVGDGYDRWLERRAHRASLDRRVDRWRYDLARLLQPTPLDWHWYRLPDRLSALYGPVRLVRLCSQQAAKAWSSVSGRAAGPPRAAGDARPSTRAARRAPGRCA